MIQNVGDLITWYEYYACGSIVKDFGVGIVTNTYQAHDSFLYHVLTDDGTLRHCSGWEIDSYEKYMDRQDKS